MPRALVLAGGWGGHHPGDFADLYRSWLTADGFEVEVIEDLAQMDRIAKYRKGDLFVPHWTMGPGLGENASKVYEAVAKRGVAVAGCHGGMCDAFREDSEWQFMTGGQFVAHPGNDGLRHLIHIGPRRHAITEGLTEFEVATEQYYMHVDPAVKVLAYSTFPQAAAPGPHGKQRCRMPVTWTKQYGRGRVFYCSLGHHPNVFDNEMAAKMLRRGLRWAAGWRELN